MQVGVDLNDRIHDLDLVPGYFLIFDASRRGRGGWWGWGAGEQEGWTDLVREQSAGYIQSSRPPDFLAAASASSRALLSASIFWRAVGGFFLRAADDDGAGVAAAAGAGYSAAESAGAGEGQADDGAGDGRADDGPDATTGLDVPALGMPVGGRVEDVNGAGGTTEDDDGWTVSDAAGLDDGTTEAGAPARAAARARAAFRADGNASTVGRSLPGSRDWWPQTAHESTRELATAALVFLALTLARRERTRREASEPSVEQAGQQMAVVVPAGS